MQKLTKVANQFSSGALISAMSGIQTQNEGEEQTLEEEQEEETEKKHDKTALEMRKFILGFVEAKFNEKDDIKSISGNWKSERDILYQFEIEGNKIKFVGQLFNTFFHIKSIHFIMI